MTRDSGHHPPTSIHTTLPLPIVLIIIIISLYLDITNHTYYNEDDP